MSRFIVLGYVTSDPNLFFFLAEGVVIRGTLMENYHSFPLILFHLQEDQNCKKKPHEQSRKQLENCKLSSSFFLNKPEPVAAGRQLRVFLSLYQLFFFSSLFSSRGLPIRAPCASPFVVAVTIEEGRITTTTTTTTSSSKSTFPHHHHHHAVAAPSCPPPRRDLILPSCSCAAADTCTS